jgi:hypothetical protein
MALLEYRRRQELFRYFAKYPTRPLRIQAIQKDDQGVAVPSTSF